MSFAFNHRHRRIYSLLLGNAAHKLGSAIKVFIVINVKFLFFSGDHTLCDVAVGSFETKHHGFLELVLFVGFND